MANTIYTWDFSSGNVTKLVEYKDYELASSLSWDIGGEKLVIGSVLGKVQIWDAQKKQAIITFNDHRQRVGAVSLIDKMLVTGSRDKKIHLYDLRAKAKPIKTYFSHK